MTMNEKRAKKYPDTKTFHFYNANPKGRITGDCVIRAICTALKQPYEQTIIEMARMTVDTGWMLDEKKGIDKYLQSKGWIKCKQPKKLDGTKYTGKEFCQTLAHPLYSEQLHLTNRRFERNNLIANIGSHHIVAIMNGRICDIWNSENGSIGTVWVKAF